MVLETSARATPKILDASPAIEASGLRKVFGKKVAVDSLTLQVGRSEVFGFLGPNGAGKTTAIKMLMGLVAPTAGTASILGRPIDDLKMRERIGFLPELFRFHDWLRATELLDFHGELYGMTAEKRRKRIPEVLELTGLTASANEKLKTFSKGMQQRIGLAQALLNEPDVVFLDEPTSALDPIGRREVRDIIKHLRQLGVTVFLNSHMLSEVEMVCDRVAIINLGKVVRAGRLEELLTAKLQVSLRVEGITPEITGELKSLASRMEVDGSKIELTLDHEGKLPLLAQTVVGNGGRLYEMTPKRESLEDLFVEVVEGTEKPPK